MSGLTSEELTVPQVAQLLALNEETIRRYLRAGRLKAVKRGTQWFVRPVDLEVFRAIYQPQVGRHLKDFDNLESLAE